MRNLRKELPRDSVRPRDQGPPSPGKDRDLAPAPETGDRWSSTTLDLTLDAEIRPWDRWADRRQVIIDPTDPTFNTNERSPSTRPRGLHSRLGPGAGAVRAGLDAGEAPAALPFADWRARRGQEQPRSHRPGDSRHGPIIHPGFGESDQPGHVGSAIRLEIWNIGPSASG